jgi:hypothetical protein
VQNPVPAMSALIKTPTHCNPTSALETGFLPLFSKIILAVGPASRRSAECQDRRDAGPTGIRGFLQISFLPYFTVC